MKIIIAVLVYLVKMQLSNGLKQAARYHQERQELEELAREVQEASRPEKAYQAAMSHGIAGYFWKPNNLGFAAMVAV